MSSRGRARIRLSTGPQWSFKYLNRVRKLLAKLAGVEKIELDPNGWVTIEGSIDSKLIHSILCKDSKLCNGVRTVSKIFLPSQDPPEYYTYTAADTNTSYYTTSRGTSHRPTAADETETLKSSDTTRTGYDAHMVKSESPHEARRAGKEKQAWVSKKGNGLGHYGPRRQDLVIREPSSEASFSTSSTDSGYQTQRVVGETSIGAPGYQSKSDSSSSSGYWTALDYFRDQEISNYGHRNHNYGGSNGGDDDAITDYGGYNTSNYYNGGGGGRYGGNDNSGGGSDWNTGNDFVDNYDGQGYHYGHYYGNNSADYYNAGWTMESNDNYRYNYRYGDSQYGSSSMDDVNAAGCSIM